MFILKFASSVIFIALITVTLAFKLQPKIVNGKSAYIGQFPYFAQLTFLTNNGSSSICGGSLITDKFILTAAHCTEDFEAAKVILGYLTMHNNSGTQKFTILRNEFYVHPDFDLDSVPNDIALLRLPQKAKFTLTVQPIKLAIRALDQYIDVIAVGSGLTKPQNYKMSSILQYTELKTIPNSMCVKFYPFLENLRGVLCVWSPNHSSIYLGDSGGPIVLKEDRKLIGVSSFGLEEYIDKAIPQGVIFLPYHFKWISKVTVQYLSEYLH